MPAKKKKGKKKKASKKVDDGLPKEEKKDEEEKPKEPDITEFVPEAHIFVMLCGPTVDQFCKSLNFITVTNCLLYFLAFDVKLPVTARLFEIEDLIQEKHGGACGPVSLCLGMYQPNQCFKDKTKMLKEVSIATQTTYKIQYDFEAYSHPLLTTTIRRDEEKVFKPPSKEEWDKIRSTNV